MANNEKKAPSNYHAMYDSGTRRLRGVPALSIEPRQSEGHKRLERTVTDLVIDYDEATELPNRICSRKPGVSLSEPSDETPEAVVSKFINDERDLWELSSDDAESVEVVSVSTKGLSSVRLIQRVQGIEVFNSDVTVGIDQHNAVVSIAGQFFPGVAASKARNAIERPISVSEAIAKAAGDLCGYEYAASEFVSVEAPPNAGPYGFYQHNRLENDDRPGFERPIRVKEVIFPLGAGEFVRGWYMELWIKSWPAFSYVIDSVDDPDILYRKNITSSATFKYRVHNTEDLVTRPEDGPAPGSPHPTGTPDGFQAQPIAEVLVEIESLIPGDPWLPNGATETRGNNCIAYADLQFPDGLSQGDIMGKITGPNEFGNTYDHAKAADDLGNLQNSIVGMFFHVNWLHDRWYEGGFDEASGNAQQDNYGRGGLGGDPILAEGNDFRGTDNANMSTPAEGSSPRMQMFEFTGTNPTRTSNHEALITFHEMGHYVTNRLVGNSNGLNNQQGGAMGEGWGDFFAICMTSQGSDDFDTGAFPIGGWTDKTDNFDQNYYYSIRRYPYSADMTKNPLTFKHIGDNVFLPSGPPRNPVFWGWSQLGISQRRRDLVLRALGRVRQFGRRTWPC